MESMKEIDSLTMHPPQPIFQQTDSSNFVATFQRFNTLAQDILPRIGSKNIDEKRNNMKLLKEEIDAEEKLACEMDAKIRELSEKEKQLEERKVQNESLIDGLSSKIEKRKNEIQKAIDSIKHDYRTRMQLYSRYKTYLNIGVDYVPSRDCDVYKVAFLNSDLEEMGSIELQYRAKAFDVSSVTVNPNIDVTDLLVNYKNNRCMQQLLYGIRKLLLKEKNAPTESAVPPKKV